jgi:hypothetical protein
MTTVNKRNHRQLQQGKTDEWLSPPHIVRALGEFDLDPCVPVIVPDGFEYAPRRFNVLDDGLAQEWRGRVWLNPPYSHNKNGSWIRRLREHGDGIAMVFARCETAWWQDEVWPYASAILFLRGRPKFYTGLGIEADHGSIGCQTLIAYGENNHQALLESRIPGALVDRVHMLGAQDA